MKTTGEKEKKLNLALSKLKNLKIENPNIKKTISYEQAEIYFIFGL